MVSKGKVAKYIALQKTALLCLLSVLLLGGCTQPHPIQVENDVRATAIWDLISVYEHSKNDPKIPRLSSAYLYHNEVDLGYIHGKVSGRSLSDFEQQLRERPLRISSRESAIGKKWTTIRGSDVVFEASYRSSLRWFVLGITAGGKIVRVSGNDLPSSAELADLVASINAVRSGG